jgi:hypothetical protein
VDHAAIDHADPFHATLSALAFTRFATCGTNTDTSAWTRLAAAGPNHATCTTNITGPYAQAGVVTRAGIAVQYTDPCTYNTNLCLQSITTSIDISGCPTVSGFAAIRGCAAISVLAAAWDAIIPTSIISAAITTAAEDTAPSRMGPVLTMQQALP